MYLTYLSGHFKPPSQISVETVIASRRGTRPFGSTRPFLDVVGPMESGKCNAQSTHKRILKDIIKAGQTQDRKTPY